MPISAPESPRRMAALANVADVEHSRRSAPRQRANPPPTQGPLTAATTGCGRERRPPGKEPMRSWKRMRSDADAAASGTPGPKSRTSRPEQKPRPAPVRTMARVVVPPASRAHAASSARTSSSLRALSRSGRLRRSRGTPGAGGSTSRTPAISDPFDDGGGPHAAPGAHRHQAGGEVASFQLVENGPAEHGTGGADRVAQRNGAAVDVHRLGVEIEVTHGLERHRGERLVDLPQVDVAD